MFGDRRQIWLLATSGMLAVLSGCQALGTVPWLPRGQLVLELADARSRTPGSVVYLELASPSRGGSAGGGPQIEVASEGPSFRPSLAAVHRGGEVVFVNRGRVAHRIFTTGARGRQERFVAPHAVSKALQISRPGENRFYCSLHPDESFVVFAAPSRHFAIANGTPALRIEDVRTGSYRMTWWSEDGVQSLGRVEIGPGETVMREISLGPIPPGADVRSP